MKSSKGRAPSKLILFGEHAVVYGQPALAVPLRRPGAGAEVSASGPNEPVRVVLEDLGQAWAPGAGEPSEEMRPFARLLEALDGAVPKTGWTLRVRSSVPIGCGLGSGASVATAALRAVDAAFGIGFTPEALCAAVYETEKILHGSPSGVDNTVIAMERPVLFRKGEPFETIPAPAAPLPLVIADTGVSHKTAGIVAEVAAARADDPEGFDATFAEIGDLTAKGAEAFRSGDLSALGKLMDRNQELLRGIGVSSPELDRLVAAARAAGALGAKLSGAGRGGCMAALAADEASAERVRTALESAGAKRVLSAEILTPPAEAAHAG